MDILFSTLLELAMFFALLLFVLQLFNSFNYEKLFKKGHTKQIQVIYIMSAIVFTYLLTRAIMNLIELSTNLV